MEIIKAYLPAQVTVKSRSGVKKGDDKMIICGVAATLDRDADGEILDPNGMELSYFLTKGHINWNHLGQFDPEAIIGYPMSAEVMDDKLVIEGELYKNSEIAKKAFALMKGMEEQDAPRGLGFSIEAHVLKREDNDKKYISKSMLMDLALTPCPKNLGTSAMVVKSFTSLDDAKAFKFHEEEFSLAGSDTVKKSMSEEVDPEIQALIDVADAYGRGDISDREIKHITNQIISNKSLMSKFEANLNK